MQYIYCRVFNIPHKTGSIYCLVNVLCLCTISTVHRIWFCVVKGPGQTPNVAADMAWVILLVTSWIPEKVIWSSQIRNRSGMLLRSESLAITLGLKQISCNWDSPK